MVAALLFGVLMLRQPCSDGVAKFVGQFEPPAEKAPAPAPTQETPDQNTTRDAKDGRYIRLGGEMSEDEIRETLRRAGVKDGEPAKADGLHTGNGGKSESTPPTPQSTH